MAKPSIRGLTDQNFMLGQNMRIVHYNLKHRNIEISCFWKKFQVLIGFQLMLLFIFNDHFVLGKKVLLFD